MKNLPSESEQRGPEQSDSKTAKRYVLKGWICLAVPGLFLLLDSIPIEWWLSDNAEERWNHMTYLMVASLFVTPIAVILSSYYAVRAWQLGCVSMLAFIDAILLMCVILSVISYFI